MLLSQQSSVSYPTIKDIGDIASQCEEQINCLATYRDGLFNENIRWVTRKETDEGSVHIINKQKPIPTKLECFMVQILQHLLLYGYVAYRKSRDQYQILEPTAYSIKLKYGCIQTTLDRSKRWIVKILDYPGVNGQLTSSGAHAYQASKEYMRLKKNLSDRDKQNSRPSIFLRDVLKTSATQDGMPRFHPTDPDVPYTVVDSVMSFNTQFAKPTGEEVLDAKMTKSEKQEYKRRKVLFNEEAQYAQRNYYIEPNKDVPIPVPHLRSTENWLEEVKLLREAIWSAYRLTPQRLGKKGGTERNSSDKRAFSAGLQNTDMFEKRLYHDIINEILFSVTASDDNDTGSVECVQITYKMTPFSLPEIAPFIKAPALVNHLSALYRIPKEEWNVQAIKAAFATESPGAAAPNGLEPKKKERSEMDDSTLAQRDKQNSEDLKKDDI